MKKLKIIIIGAILALSGLAANAQSNTVVHEVRDYLKNNATITLEEEFRFNADSDKFFYQHSDIQLKEDLGHYADVFVSYRLIFQDKGKGFNSYNMFVPGFDLKTAPGKYGKLNLRSKVEILLDSPQGPASYQDAEFLKWSAPWKWTRYEINPFLGDEVFFDCANKMNPDRNRIYAGLDCKFTDHINGSLFYYRQSDRKNNDWSDSNVVIVQVKFKF